MNVAIDKLSHDAIKKYALHRTVKNKTAGNKAALGRVSPRKVLGRSND
jgi:hypothetical protein